MTDADVPRVGVEELAEPEDHYRLVINGEKISGAVLLSRDELEGLDHEIHQLLRKYNPFY